LTGDAENADPACDLSPHHHLVEAAVADTFRPGRFQRPLVLRRWNATTSAFVSPGA
jgi:pyrroloquinoline quinone biosynthesis protein E